MKPDDDSTDATRVSQEPKSEHDWTVHSLNIHGTFFERRCQHVVSTTVPWKLTTTNYPVEVEGHESNLDIRADLEIPPQKLILLIECKKNNPDLVNWVFFPKKHLGNSRDSRALLPQLQTLEGRKGEHLLCAVDTGFPIVTDARETRGSYLSYSKQKSDKTRTSNSAITDAANQITVATAFIEKEETNRSWAFVRAKKPLVSPISTIVPTIVTSARLFICEHDPGDVYSETGEVAYDKVELSAVDYVVYEYALPRHLCGVPNDAVWVEAIPLDQLVRRHILVVHSGKLSAFLHHAMGWLLR